MFTYEGFIYFRTNVFVHTHLGTCSCLCFRTNICMYEFSNKDMQDKCVCKYIFVSKQCNLVYAYITDKNCVVFASGYTNDVNIYDFGNVWPLKHGFPWRIQAWMDGAVFVHNSLSGICSLYPLDCCPNISVTKLQNTDHGKWVNLRTFQHPFHMSFLYLSMHRSVLISLG